MPRRFSSIIICGLLCLVPLLSHGFVTLPSSSPLFRLTSSSWLSPPRSIGSTTTAPQVFRPAPTVFRTAPLFLSPPPISSSNIVDAEVVSREFSTTTASASDAVSTNQQATSSSTTTKNPKDGASTNKDDEDHFGISYSEAIQRTLVYVAAACLFGLGIAWKSSIADAQQFFATYFLEQSLSVDNLLVFCSVFSLFEIPLQYQNKILNWGIFCAALFRILMIGGGSMAFSHYPVAKLICGLFLLTTAGNGTLKTYLQHTDNDDNDSSTQKHEEDPSYLAKNLLSLTQIPTSLFPYTRELHGDQFMVHTPERGYVFTPMFLCLLAIEIADVLFAFDSVPAGLGVTRTPWILMTSNLFAILGLRSMFLIVSKVTADLEYMEIGLSAILAFLGSSMVMEYWGGYPPMDTTMSVGFVGTVLAGTVGASLWKRQQEQEQQQEPSNTAEPAKVMA
eukprot:Nitzschia sp. Nitz4//scaffold101_size76361//1877//3384//NITZ4_005591-RA/size76361-processed-gene-0.15-mRNA-1//1//CDS//3329532125//5721//frame0